VLRLGGGVEADVDGVETRLLEIPGEPFGETCPRGEDGGDRPVVDGPDEVGKLPV